MASVEDLPRRAAARTVKLAGLPLGYAGRATLGLGKRIGGRPAEIVAAEVQARTAEQLFKVLGELKGGAMKFGQAMSVFEAALPENLAGPYRETLTKLQEAAPPLPASTVHRVLARELGTGWRDRFREFDDVPAAAASIGQVHRAVWSDGRDGRGQGAVPGRRPGAAVRPQPDRPDEPAGRDARARPGGQAADRRAQGPGRRGARLRAGGRAARRAFADGVRRRPGRPGAPRSSTRTKQVLVSEWVDGAAAVAGASPTARRSSATGPACCSPGSCSPARPAPGCCTPTRTPATSGCSTTAGSWCSTTAP